MMLFTIIFLSKIYSEKYPEAGIGEMTWMVKEFARVEARSLVSSIHLSAQNPSETPSPDVCRNCMHTIPPPHTQADTPTYKIKINESFKERVSQS